MKKKDLESKREEGHELFTPTFDVGEVDYERDSQTPEVEEVIDEQDAINKSAAEFNRTSDKVVEEVEAEDQDTKLDDGGNDDDDYGREGAKSYHPDEHLANHELPTWCTLDSQDEAGCQDTITGSSGLMDRYLVRRMAQIIKPMYT